MTFYLFDLDLAPMTMILKLDLDMVKMYLHTKNEVPFDASPTMIKHLKLYPQTFNSLFNWPRSFLIQDDHYIINLI